jgi:phosphoribosylformylglycinamidine synthase
MWQLSEAIDGMAEACRALGLPVIGGNVSLYNESRGSDIDPTPVVGTLGLVEELRRPPAKAALVPGGAIVLLGPTAVSLAGSRWAVNLHGHRSGTLPDLDLEMHARLVRLVADLVYRGVSAPLGGADTGPLLGVHDVSDGGLGVALAEMAVSGGTGFRVQGVAGHARLFGEGPSRVLLCVEPARVSEVLAAAGGAGIAAEVIGEAGGTRLVVEGLLDLPLEVVAARWAGDLPASLAGSPA